MSEISQDEYFRLAKSPHYRIVTSPSYQHFRHPKSTHLHSVLMLNDDTDEVIASFIQRGPKVRFYTGQPQWADFMPVRRKPKPAQP